MPNCQTAYSSNPTDSMDSMNFVNSTVVILDGTSAHWLYEDLSTPVASSISSIESFDSIDSMDSTDSIDSMDFPRTFGSSTVRVFGCS